MGVRTVRMLAVFSGHAMGTYMAWVVPTVFTLILLGLLFSGLVSRRLDVGPAGDWIMGWWVLLLCYIVIEIPGQRTVSDGFVAFLGPLFPLMMLSGAYRYAGLKVPKKLPAVALALCGVAGASMVVGIPARAEMIGLFVHPVLFVSAAIVVIPTANFHGTILQRLTAPGLLTIGAVQGLDALGGIYNWNEWNSLLLWLVTGLTVATLQVSGAFELVGDRLTKASEERDRNAEALARTNAELRKAHAQMENRVTERTAQLREEVSERHKIEATLRTSEMHYRKVTSLLTDFSYAARVGPDGELTTEWLTGAILRNRTVNQSKNELDDRPSPRTVIHPDDLPELARSLKVALDGGVTDFEARIKRDGEARLWVGGRMIGERVEPSGDLVIYATGRDITADKAAELENTKLRERVRESQRLESLGALARGVAHDFNNLLSVILGNAVLIAEALPPGSKLAERAQRIRKSARYAADIAMQILTYSGNASVSPEPLDIVQLVSEMSELIEAGTRQHIQLELQLDEDLPQIMGDPGQIRQVVLNLITNASEAMGEDGGHVRLHTGTTHVDAAALAELHPTAELIEGDYVYLEVADDGPGMDAETRARVFDPFFSTKLSGRGLGLAVVHGILRAHNAAITVSSTPGAGTQFRVLFPVLAASAVCSKPVPPIEGLRLVPSPPPHVAATILVIDDDESVSELAEAVLERVGFDVLVASGGREGLEILEKNKNRIALVVLDLAMPDMGGEVVLRRIRHVFPDLPVVISSGYAEAIAGARVRATRRVDYVAKPYEPDTLVERVRSMLPAS